MQTYLVTYFWPTLYFISGYYHFKKIQKCEKLCLLF